MNTNKRYWLRGLTAGFIIYVLGILVVYVTSMGDEWGPAFEALLVTTYFSPVILLGLLIGWIYGKIKNK